MSLRVTQYTFNGPTTQYGVGGSTYDYTKTNLGTLLVQNTGSAAIDNWAGPYPIAIARPMEASTAIAIRYPHVISWSDTIDWIFLSENATTKAVPQSVLYEFNKVTNTFNWKGYVKLELSPGAATHIINGFRAVLNNYTTGTVQVNGTSVTGSGTLWRTSGMCSGSRIGFGSATASQIQTWYELQYISGDSSSLLTTSAGTFPASTPYIIEDLRLTIASVAATQIASGGLYLVKGLRPELWNSTGTRIISSSIDNSRGIYYLKENLPGLTTNTGSAGLSLKPITNWQTQSVYILDGASTIAKIYEYNIRANLSLNNSKTTSAHVISTGQQNPIVGNISQANNCRYGILRHGPTSGSEGIYFVTTTRTYFVPITSIQSGSISFIGSTMVEIPPGGVSTYAATSVQSAVEIADNIDRLIITTTGAAGVRSYVTEFNTISSPYTHIFLSDDKQIDQSTSNDGASPHPSILATPFSVWSENGRLYLCRNGTTAILNQIYTVPIGAHWTYAALDNNYQRLITPQLSTTNCIRFKNVYINSMQQAGIGTFGLPPEPFRIYYRTSGITDNSGNWILLDDISDLSGVAASTSIQFAIEFKIIGENCIPNKIYSLAVIYEDNSTDSHYQPSVGNSNITDKRFAWRFSTAFGSTVPSLKVQLYDAVSNGLLLTDYSNSGSYGTWEKSTESTPSWGVYNSTDKANDTTYIRYTPTTLADNIRVRALLTIA